MKMRKLLLGCAIAAAAVFVLLGLAFGALVVHTYYANTRANEAAARFCATLPVGTDLDAAVKAVPAGGQWNHRLDHDDQHRFIYFGSFLYTRECIAKTVDGKVVSTELRTDD